MDQLLQRVRHQWAFDLEHSGRDETEASECEQGREQLGYPVTLDTSTQPEGDGTRARSEESWDGLLPRLLKGYSRKTLDRGIRNILGHLKTEAERRSPS